MTYNPAISRLAMTTRIAKLPIDKRGYPVPKFVTWIKGEPDFRVVNARWLMQCVVRNLCWICGGTLGVHKAFVIGPMCAINRVSSEPPSHFDCAKFSVYACPFMTQPGRRRDARELPTAAVNPAGIMVERNPGVSLIWVTKQFTPFKESGGTLFRLGPPEQLTWYKQGRHATREEIMESIESGLPLLRKIAEEEGLAAIAELTKQIERGLALVPAA